jgi:hypothetical protein
VCFDSSLFRAVLLFVTRGVILLGSRRKSHSPSEIAFAKVEDEYIGGTSTAHGGENKTSEILVSAIVKKHLQRISGTR